MAKKVTMATAVAPWPLADDDKKGTRSFMIRFSQKKMWDDRLLWWQGNDNNKAATIARPQ